MPLTFDLLLSYYDNPVSLHNWLARLFLQTDFLQYEQCSNLIVFDTGSPLDRIPDTLAVLKRWAPYKKAIYVRTDTESIRALVPPGIHARPGAYACNVASRDVSRADLLIYSCIGNVLAPEYFSQILAMHEGDDRLFVQPKQFRLHSPTYHTWWYDQPLAHALASGTITEAPGLPDISVRRQHVLAIGGWDEDFITWGMVDIDFCSRLTGKIDHGIPAEQWYKNFTGNERECYNNFGLTMVMPNTPRLASLICNDYRNHIPDADTSRSNGLQFTMDLYLSRWGIIQRNQNPKPVPYRVYENY